MRRFVFISTATLVLFLASTAHAQEVNPQSDLNRLMSRTEARARGVRLNFERMLANYPEFLPELQGVAARLGTRPEWLLNVMACESSFIPSARNPQPGQTASGLIQIIEGTARSLGTTTAAIRRMDPVRQLQLVEKYFAQFRGRLNSLADVYLAAFRGFIVSGGPEVVIAPLSNSPRERQAYLLNKGLDLDRDKRITKGELAMTAFGVGRFGDNLHLAAQTISQPNAAQHQGTPESTRPRAMNKYVTKSASRNTNPSSTRTEITPVVIPRTRSIYFN